MWELNESIFPLFPCVFCDLPTPRYHFYNTTCAFCLWVGYEGKNIMDNYEQSLRDRRSELLLELSAVDNELREYLKPVATTKSIRTFPCTCGLEFPYYLERLVHIDKYYNDDHRADGEILNGMHIRRDESICGNPIAQTSKPSITKTPKGTTFKRGLLPADMDDLA